MEQRYVGRSGLSVSRLGLGTMMWGRDTGPEEAASQLRTFAEAGGTLIDTADVYSGGEAELLLGRLIRDVVPRSELVIATKAVLTPDGRRPCDASRRHLVAAADASLARLGVNDVELWQLHAFDPEVPLEETLAAVDTIVSSGRAAYAGVCNYAGWQLAAAAAGQRAGGAGRTPIVAAQAEYSLLARDAERELLPAAEYVGAGLLAWSPLGRGVLTGKYRTGIPADSRAATPHFAEFVRPYLDERSRRVVESVTTAAEGLGVSPLSVALSWVRDQPGVAAAIVGARTNAQLAGVLKAEDLTLPHEIREALDDVSAE
ncbi:aryl-alcohol dehydrogenase-like predicted oxidoreductase [Thermocatellispora tengchongensis]|uniref:Aryl-alcohol dehydrogenase-like predicted oxidoreductase n=1 Tax=Thermocatellispora tengchongensis TaxID=1073253 RepID=A0A840PFE3_9ACTN|nr:aldo/keto reductase [Thermocatellispora tengchongensis]MBB5135867.1 aryl-alcohol dehydrogenase-like predicted oxidoreductase [Thermocatellispora tengchongensis]